MTCERLRSRCRGFSPEPSLVVRFQEPARANGRRSQSEHSAKANLTSARGLHRNSDDEGTVKTACLNRASTTPLSQKKKREERVNESGLFNESVFVC